SGTPRVPHAWLSYAADKDLRGDAVHRLMAGIVVLLLAYAAGASRAADLTAAEMKEAAVKAATLAADLANGYLETKEYVEAVHFADVADKAAAKAGDEKFAASIRAKTDSV